MKCFIHTAKEAVAACRTCGKGMCADCSAYSGHSGICPECRKKEFEKEIQRNCSAIRKHTWEIVKWVFLTVLLAITVIGLIVGIVKIVSRVNKRNTLKERNATLLREINRLNHVLTHRGGAAFV